MLPNIKNFLWYITHVGPNTRTNRNVSNNFIMDTLKYKGPVYNYDVIRKINEKGDTSIFTKTRYGQTRIQNDTREYNAYNKSLDEALSPKDREIKIEKNQKGKGKRDWELETPVTTPVDSSKVEYIRFPKISPFGTSHTTATFKGPDGRTHTWVKYSDGVYNWRVSPGYQMNTYSPKQTNVTVKNTGLAGVKSVSLPIDKTIMSQIDNLMKNK